MAGLDAKTNRFGVSMAKVAEKGEAMSDGSCSQCGSYRDVSTMGVCAQCQSKPTVVVIGFAYPPTVEGRICADAEQIVNEYIKEGRSAEYMIADLARRLAAKRYSHERT
jgi:hypothetical protein